MLFRSLNAIVMIGFAQNVLRESSLVHDLFSQRSAKLLHQCCRHDVDEVYAQVPIDDNLSRYDNGKNAQARPVIAGAVISWLRERVPLA